MIIEGSFYRIIPADDNSKFFDLELLKDIKGNNPRKEFKHEAYSLTLDKAIERCINYATRKKFLDKVVTLKEYLDELKQQTKNIKETLSYNI